MQSTLKRFFFLYKYSFYIVWLWKHFEDSFPGQLFVLFFYRQNKESAGFFKAFSNTIVGDVPTENRILLAKKSAPQFSILSEITKNSEHPPLT